jgi:hypothetical protein
VDYHWFKLLTDKGVFFVTRLRAKAVYRVEERRYADSKHWNPKLQQKAFC